MGHSAHTPASSIIVTLEKQLADLQSEFDTLQAFYKLTVLERDYARQKNTELRKMLDIG